MIRTALAFLLLLLPASLPCLPAVAGVPATGPDPEQAQRGVAVSSGQAAIDCHILAEEMEINFGPEKAREAQDAETALNQVAGRDVPAVIEEMAKLRSGDMVDARAAARGIGVRQEVILRRLRGLMKPVAPGLSLEALKEKARAAAEAQLRNKAALSRLASATRGRTADMLTARERDAIGKLKEQQSQVSAGTAALEASARRLASDQGADAAARENVSHALQSADLASAAREAVASAKSIGDNDLDQAIAQQDAVLRGLENFKSALDGRRASGSMSEQLADLAARERRLSELTAESSHAASASRAARQDEIRKEVERLSADMPYESIARSYAAAAADEMRNAAEALSRADSRDGETSRQPRGDTAARQRKSADYLDGARKALEDAKLSELQARAQSTEQALAAARKRLEELGGLAKSQQGLQRRTESEQPRSQALKEMAAEQSSLRESASKLAAASNARRASEALPGQKTEDSARARAQSDKLRGAANAMRAASEALSQSKGRMAAARQEKASSNLEAARDEEARQVAALSQSLAKSAGALRRTSPAPVPPQLDTAFAAMAGAKGSKPAPSAKKVAASPGQPASTEGGPGSSGMRGLSQGRGGPMGGGGAGRAWQAQLPPGTPPEIVQSAHSAFPRGYEETLRRYYERIARQ